MTVKPKITQYLVPPPKMSGQCRVNVGLSVGLKPLLHIACVGCVGSNDFFWSFFFYLSNFA